MEREVAGGKPRDYVCAECGAGSESETCTELFLALLALDHQRLAPWGRFHGLNVACFYLQHPSTMTVAALSGQWQTLTSYLQGGIEAVDQLAAMRVRQNRRGQLEFLDLHPPPERLWPATVTIKDVAVDGTFPASGYEDRMRSWAQSIASERSADGPKPRMSR